MKTLLICLVATVLLFSCRKTSPTLNPPITDPPTTDTPLTVHTKKMGGLRHWQVDYESYFRNPIVFDTTYTYMDTFEINITDDTTLDLGYITTNNIVSFKFALTKPDRLVFNYMPDDPQAEQIWVNYMYKSDAITIQMMYYDSVKQYLRRYSAY